MYLFFITVLMFFLLLWIKIQLEIKVIIKDRRNLSFLIVRLLHLLRLRVNFSIDREGKRLFSLSLRKNDSEIKEKTSLEQVWKYIRKLVNFYTNHTEPINFMKSKVRVDNFSIRSRIGTGDAASTALAFGSFYAFFSLISSHLNEYYHLQGRKLDILPHFQGPLFDLDLSCIINFRIGHIIITGLKILAKKVKAVL